MKSFQTVLLISGVLTLVTGFSLNGIQGRSHRLEGSKFATEIVKNFLQCKSLCDRRSLCKSVNYNTRTRECTSNFRDVTTSTTSLQYDVPAIVYAEKPLMPQNAGVCERNLCEDTQVCTQVDSRQNCFTEEISCGEPPDVPNTRKTASGTFLNSVAIYSCSVGYMVFNGTPTSTCDVTRRWSQTNLSCIEINCGEPPDIPNTSNSVTIYSCSVGYVVFNGTTTSTCDVTQRWRQTNLSCIEINCGEPPDIPNTSKTANGTVLNSVAIYSCSVGYVVFNGTTTSICDVTRRWSQTNLSCIEIKCGEPPNVPNTSKTMNGTVLNSVAIYSCSVGNVMFNGTTTSTCDVTQRWSQTNLSCIVDCGVLTVSNGVFNNESTTLGSNGSVECDADFRFFGNSSSVRCDATGQWNGLGGDCRQVEWRNENPKFTAFLPEPIKDGWEMILRATPTSDAKRFTINLVYLSDVYAHFDVRFDAAGKVRKALFDYKLGSWNKDLKFLASFPFDPLVPFELRIQLQSNVLEFSIYKDWDVQIDSKKRVET
ncbi:sushi, von Willebrand factor type A, EGF and pentraxin domain-containing protein 1-like [Gigantopelta aegis]|uniref:sushi, von Willebrand factor type A, EGF and pentraxin domain-containing protein 1-like n=1 Tax=Gigantopelta aegis TaxID=1735272 RepID=UPI001B88C5A3|nr:sushi, von Willebrand factor type A, EGF and pentraxin domain-containing protein 1-like [Gigantopelta aegis]